MSTIRLILLLEAASFVAAALIHFGVLIDGHEHWKAGVAESVIAAVLTLGFTIAMVAPAWARRVGLVAQIFALLGTFVGLFTIVIGIGPRTAPDIAFHMAIVGVLIWGLTLARRVSTH